MCYYFAQTKRLKELARKYKSEVEPGIEWFPEYYLNGFESPKIPVLTNQSIQLMNWGLIPSWVKTKEKSELIRLKTLNAKSETVFEKPSFQSIETKRCVIPASGFFEWQHTSTGKQPYYIYAAEEDILSMAGIFDLWLDPTTGNILTTCSILTTEANTFMSTIHNTKQRMPLFLTEEKRKIWLNNDWLSQWNFIKQPISSSYLLAHPISNIISQRGADKNTSKTIEKVSINMQQRLF